MAEFRRRFNILIAVIGLVLVFNFSLAENNDDVSIDVKPAGQSATEDLKLSGIETLGELLKSDKPTLAYFYQSVACSCVAARCAMAAATIDSLPELKDNDKFNFARVDVFYTDQAEPLYKINLVPALAYFNAQGIEIKRLEWDISVELLKKLIAHPEKKLTP